MSTISDRCVASLFNANSRKFVCQQLALPPLRPGEILVKVLCCTICGSDMHTVSGRRAAPPSCVLGHEIVGEICEFYADPAPLDFFGKPLRIGQRVTWNMAVGCGDCFYCQSGIPQKCDFLFKYGHADFDGVRPTGGLATHCILVPGTSVFPVPNSLSDFAVCPMNCATATVFAAIRSLRETHAVKKGSVMVIGMGMLGLTAAAMLAEIGAQQVVCVDLESARLNAASHFGGTHFVDAGSLTTGDELKRLSYNERGCDAVLDFSGSENAISLAIDCLRVGGAAILAGSVFPSKPLDLSPETVVRRLLTIRGIHNYCPADLAGALEFLNRNATKYPFEGLVSKSFRLEQVQAAFVASQSREHVRVAVIP